MLVWLAGLALAQNPGLPQGLQGLPPGFSLSNLMPGPDARWMSAEVVSQRFPGESVAGPTFTAGEQVEVIIADGEKVRIRAGERYGWVAAAQLGTVAPAAPALNPTANGLLGGLPPLLPGNPPRP